MMHTIPDDVRRFVLACIPSVPFLEALLVFHAAPDRAFGIDEIAAVLYVQEDRARELVEALAAAGMVEADGPQGAQWRHAPRDPALAAAVDALAAAYPKHLIAITHLIHDTNARNSQRFADAFRFRKDT